MEFFFEKSPVAEATRIRSALQNYEGVKFEAYNEAEVRAIQEHLTKEERARVSFSWFTWGQRSNA